MNETEKSLFFLLFQQFRLARMIVNPDNNASEMHALPEGFLTPSSTRIFTGIYKCQ